MNIGEKIVNRIIGDSFSKNKEQDIMSLFEYSKSPNGSENYILRKGLKEILISIHKGNGSSAWLVQAWKNEKRIFSTEYKTEKAAVLKAIELYKKYK